MISSKSMQLEVKQFKAAPAVRLERISKSFDGVANVLNGIDLQVEVGEVVTILGQSGGGKSTLLRCINLLCVPDAGVVEVAGERAFVDGKLAPIKTLAALRRQAGMVFQQFHLFPHMTAVENIVMPMVRVLSVGEDEAIDVAIRLLERVGLRHRTLANTGTMSGGEQQRLAIARAMALRPALLLFDEPTSALDPESTSEVNAVIRELAEQGMTMVVVTHDIPFARRVATRMVFMDDGAIVEEGPADELLRNPRRARTRAFVSGLEIPSSGSGTPRLHERER